MRSQTFFLFCSFSGWHYNLCNGDHYRCLLHHMLTSLLVPYPKQNKFSLMTLPLLFSLREAAYGSKAKMALVRNTWMSGFMKVWSTLFHPEQQTNTLTQSLAPPLSFLLSPFFLSLLLLLSLPFFPFCLQNSKVRRLAVRKCICTSFELKNKSALFLKKDMIWIVEYKVSPFNSNIILVGIFLHKLKLSVWCQCFDENVLKTAGKKVFIQQVVLTRHIEILKYPNLSIIRLKNWCLKWRNNRSVFNSPRIYLGF